MTIEELIHKLEQRSGNKYDIRDDGDDRSYRIFKIGAGDIQWYQSKAYTHSMSITSLKAMKLVSDILKFLGE
jgi:CRISPR/Cas system-associated endoribonuclease Cas2